VLKFETFAADRNRMSLIRPMTDEDIEPASRLKCRVFADTYAGHVSPERIEQWLEKSSSPRALRERLADPTRRLIVCEEAGRIIGGAIMQIQDDVGYLSAVWVDPAWRRKGVGMALAHWREQTAREAGCSRLRLHVWTGNPEGAAFALARGYAPTGEGFHDELTDSQLAEWEKAA
jgi:GNAT superfamily N-acetyltransferase